MSIGVSLLSGGEMIAGRMKGRGIVILHTHKDLLWYDFMLTLCI